MAHVFLSYCHADSDFALILEDKLRKAGFETWQDRDLSAGDDWRTAIDFAIRDALAVVVVMSPASVDSRYVNYEWSFAIGSGIPVVPILLKLPFGDLHPRLSIYQGLDFSNHLARPWDLLCTALRELADAERPYTVHVSRDAPPVIQRAAQALDSTDTAERARAIETLTQADHPAAIDVLADALRHPVRQVQVLAACRLAKKGDKRAIEPLIRLYLGGERDGGDALSWFGKDALPGLLAALETADRDRAYRAIGVLGTIAHRDAVKPLLRFLKSLDERLCRQTLWALGKIGDPEALPAIRELKTSPSAQVRQVTAEALVKCGKESVAADLLDLLRDPERSVRRSAAVEITAAMGPDIVPSLLASLQDDSEVAGYAARTLAEIGDERAIPALLACAERYYSGDWVAALRRFGERARSHVRAAITHPNAFVRETAVEVLNTVGTDEDLPLLLQAMRDKSVRVRLEAINAVAENSAAVPALIEALDDEEERVCASAAYALGRLGDPAAVPKLIECLHAEVAVDEVSSALEGIGTRSAVAAVRVWKKSAGR